jgi:phage terminase large subunit-like protein
MTTLHERLLALDGTHRAELLRTLTDREAALWTGDWSEWAHAGQREPSGPAPGSEWRTWVLMAGRGFGKTLAGAQWVAEMARRHGPVAIALVAASEREARSVMIEGPSGLLSLDLHPALRPHYERARGRVVFPGGAEATIYSGANPQGLRGPQHHFAWCDELAKWRHPQATWDMLQLGLRCGANPRALVTTTPRGGCAALKAILADEATVLTGGRTGENPHLSEAFLRTVERAYGGTRMGREEIDGVLLSDVAGSLWPAGLIERARGPRPEDDTLRRVVIGVDPPASAAGTCGIVACGLDAEGVGHVLGDHSAGGLSPEGWALRVAAAAEAHGADRVVAEKNQGGDMVGSVLRSAGVTLPISLVAATRGKVRRAEPVAGLFESGSARLAGRFPELEDELAGLVAGGDYEGPGHSPDRADAMVWALWALLIAPQARPRVRDVLGPRT